MPVAGSLSYAITLDASGFTKEIVKAGAALAGLKLAIGQIGKAIGEFTKPFEEGFRLRNMMKQTNVAISDIFKMEWALKAVGAESTDASTILTRFEKALGGVTREGQSTNYTFAMMGLNVMNLRRMPLTQALDLWLDRLRRLNATSAAFAATSIAGGLSSQTGAGGTFLRLARAIDDVREAMRRAAAQAAIFEKFGYTFYQIIRRIELIKETLKGFFVGLAGGAGPGLLYLLRQVDAFVARNSQRIVEIGMQIGRVFGIIAEAFREGNLIGVLKTAFLALLESVGNFSMQIIAAISAFTKVVMTDALDAVAKNFGTELMFQVEGAINAAKGGLGIKSVGDVLGDQIAGFISKNLSEIYGSDDRATLVNAMKAFQDAFRSSGGMFGNKNTDAFKTLYDVLGRAADRLTEKEPFGPAPGGGILGGIYHLPITAVEKMGFTFRGGPLGIPGSDYAKMTADNTAHMVMLLSDNNRLLGGNPAIGATRSFK